MQRVIFIPRPIHKHSPLAIKRQLPLPKPLPLLLLLHPTGLLLPPLIDQLLEMHLPNMTQQQIIKCLDVSIRPLADNTGGCVGVEHHFYGWEGRFVIVLVEVQSLYL